MGEAAEAPDRVGPDLLENMQIAARLQSYADLLESQGEDGFRVRAYRRAAEEVAGMDRPLRAIFAEGGLDALIALPTIGRGIAAAILEILNTGHWSQLERLEGDSAPEKLFMTIPGVGEVLAARFARSLDAHSLEDLEAALRNRELRIPGLGERRRSAILAALSARLAPIRRLRGPAHDPATEPPISLLLEADAIYRRKAAAGELRLIAPRRYNPQHKAWLPILHLRRGDWHLTLLFSNTARAHDLGRTDDWVVVFFHFADGPEHQRTITTEHRGALSGKRVVRGREEETAQHYAALKGRDAS